MSLHNLISLSRNEFIRVVGNPIVIVVGIVLLFFTFINAAGGYQTLIGISADNHVDGILVGYGQINFVTCFICAIMTAFLGVLTVNEDRFRGTFNVLLAKPVYRRDLILGKFIGLECFIVLFLVVAMIVNFVILMYYCGEPLYLQEEFIRLTAYVFILSLEMAMVLGLTMLIGTLFKNFLTSVSIVTVYLSFEWFWNNGIGPLSTILQFPLTPYNFFGNIIFGTAAHDYRLLRTSTLFTDWLAAAVPDIIIAMLIVLTLLLIDCYVFARSDDI